MIKRPNVKVPVEEMELSPLEEDFSPVVYEMPTFKFNDKGEQVESTPSLVIYIYKEISEPYHYIDFIQLLTFAAPEQEIIIRINSPGGSLSSCMSIVNSIFNSPANIHTVIDGDASSAAAFIWLAGHEKSIASEHTNLMIHGASCGFYPSKISDINTSIYSVTNTMNGLLDKLTEGILTEAERIDIAKGMDIHLCGKEIIKRLCNPED